MNWRQLLDSPLAWGMIPTVFLAGMSFIFHVGGAPERVWQLPSGTLASAMAWGVMCWVVRDLYFRKK